MVMRVSPILSLPQTRTRAQAREFASLYRFPAMEMRKLVDIVNKTSLSWHENGFGYKNVRAQSLNDLLEARKHLNACIEFAMGSI